MEIYTIGFAKRTAESFFEALRSANIRRLIDVRLNNKSQLAAFTKMQDLPFLLRELCDAEYLHEPLLAPTADLLKSYRNKEIPWKDFEQSFVDLMTERRIESVLEPELFREPAVLLCSENTADQCHRRLVVEYLAERWDGVNGVHL